MNNKNIKVNQHNYLYWLLPSVMGLIIILVSLNFYLDGDENFTIGLIHNTYENIINFDSMDVHPPLYYFLLKLFLQVFTFWTNSILVKVFFARVFSLITFIICLYIGIKLLMIKNIKIHIIPIASIFMAMPSILLYSQYIRMYMLAAMFLIIELYELVKYVKYSQNHNLIIALIMGSLAAYTHYFAAISAGLFLLYFFIKFIYYRNLSKVLKVGLSGIIYLIIYIPWMFIANKQFGMATSSKYNTNQMYTKSTYTITNFVHLFKQAVLSLVGGQSTYGNGLIKVVSVLLLLLFIYLIFWSFRNLNNKINNLLIISGINLIGTIFVAVLVSIIDHPILIDHYLFPSFTIFAFLIAYVAYQYIKYMFVSNKLHMSISWLIILALFMNVTLYAKHSAKNLIKSHTIITEMNNWSQLGGNNIHMKNTKKNIWNIASKSIYLRPMHKGIKTNNLRNTNQMFGKSNVKLLHGVYPNIKK